MVKARFAFALVFVIIRQRQLETQFVGALKPPHLALHPTFPQPDRKEVDHPNAVFLSDRPWNERQAILRVQTEPPGPSLRADPRWHLPRCQLRGPSQCTLLPTSGAVSLPRQIV